MEYRYFITEEIRNKYFKQFPFTKSFLQGCKNSTEPLKIDTNLNNKLFVQKKAINYKEMAFVWLPKYINQYCIYILRYINEFKDYENDVDKYNVEKFVKPHAQLNVTEEEEINIFHQSLIIDDNINPELTDAEKRFLDKNVPINHKLWDVFPVIYETDNWIADISSLDNSFSAIATIIFQYVDCRNKEGFNNGWDKTKSLAGKSAIIYRDNNKWILDGFKDESWALPINKSKPVDYKRGYPYTLFLDPVKWIEMEKVSKSNLALSPEQIDCININPIKYPLFITGRAGSGKSTALLYLFAEIMIRWCKGIKSSGNDSIKRPLYLSYSKDLIDDAKELIDNLFCHNHALEDFKVEYTDDLKLHLDEMFLSFENLRSDCVRTHNPELWEKRFSRGKKMSFKLFKEKWNEEFAYDRKMIKNFGANICWYIIRTYIKGWNYDSYMDVEDYRKLSRKQRQGNVSDETFQVVYERVWEGWYKKLTANDYWDDLDIVRCCLDNNWVDERFSAIFCDEAQDFTRVEIDFILRLSTFSNRKIHADDIQKLPFAFAGDEFQTLSPTGFSWESIRGYFIDRLFAFTGLDSNDNEGKKSLPKPMEFLQNYRSEPEIVKTANRIQLLRAARFANPSIPQKPYFIAQDDICYCVPLNAAPKVWENVTSDYEIALIVPKDENESYEDYIKRTGDLKEYVHFEDGFPTNISRMLTPSSAKGGEYANVILYGFGKEAKIDDLTIGKLIEWFNEPKRDTNKDIELENVICNMYVALTRATRHIYIIDDFSKESIWSFLFSSKDTSKKTALDTDELQDAMLAHLGNKRIDWDNASDDSLLGWVYDISEKEGQKMTFTTLSKEERLKNYSDYRRSYFRNEESACLEELRQLANQYKRLGKTNEYYGCLADAERKEGKYNEAANFYIKAKEYLNALDCYWIELSEEQDSKQRAQIIYNISSLDGYIDDTRAIWCDKLKSKEIHPKDIEDLLSAILKEITNVFSSVKSWDVLLNNAFDILNRQKPLGSEICNYSKMVKIAEELKENGFVVDFGKIAYLAYHFLAEDEAIKIWESRTNNLLPKEYYSLKWKKTDYPENLQYAKEMDDTSWFVKVIDLFKQNRNKKLNDKQRSIVYEAIRTNKNKDDYKEFFLEILMSITTTDSCLQFVNEVNSSGLNINPDLLKGYIQLWLEDYREFEKPKAKYQKDTMLLFDAVVDVIKLRNKEFLNIQLKSIKDGLDKEDARQEEIVIPFCDNYKKYLNTPIEHLIFFEIGKAFEKADNIERHWLSAAIYYEWIEEKIVNTFIKNEMGKRWVYCKEKQASISSKEDQKNRYLSDANKKRNILGIDGKLPSELSFSNENWAKLFSYLMNVDAQIEEVNSVDSELKKINEVSHSPVFSSKQVITYNNYRIIIMPQRGDIIIREEDTESQTIIRRGIFKEDDYYYMKEDGRIFNNILNQETPFILKASEHEAILIVFDGIENAGFSIHIIIDGTIPADTNNSHILANDVR